jgi:hypothetical protein
VIVVDGPVPEPLGQRASRLIATGAIGIVMAGLAVLITQLLLPDVPLRWLVVLTAGVCVAVGLLCIGVGLIIHAGLRHARAVRRRQPPAPPAEHRPHHRPVVIDGSTVNDGSTVDPDA